MLFCRKDVNNHSILIALALCFLILSCKKDDDDCGTNHYVNLNPELNSFRFKTDSWWVYTDSISGNQDSISVTSDTLSRHYSSGGGSGCSKSTVFYTIFISELTSHTDNYTSYYFHERNSVYNKWIDSEYSHEFAKPPIFRVGDNPGDTVYNYHNCLVVRGNSYPTLNVGGTNFNDVTTMHITGENIPYRGESINTYMDLIDKELTFYVAPGIGIVRMEAREAAGANALLESWQLTTYSIVL